MDLKLSEIKDVFMKVEFKGVPIEKKYTEIIQQIQKENEDLTSKQEVEEE